MSVPHESLAVVVGQNCERLRNAIGMTQDELARYARNLGLRWKASSVGDFEAGRSAPKFATVMSVAIALQWALNDANARHPSQSGQRPAAVNLGDLMTFDGFVLLSDTFQVRGCHLESWCRGSAPVLESPFYDQVKIRGTIVDAVSILNQRSGLAEQRQAKRLGIERAVLAALSLKLWQRTFSEERDRRAGDNASPQKRGQVTRALQAELDDMRDRFSKGADRLANLADIKDWADGDDK